MANGFKIRLICRYYMENYVEEPQFCVGAATTQQQIDFLRRKKKHHVKMGSLKIEMRNCRINRFCWFAPLFTSYPHPV